MALACPEQAIQEGTQEGHHGALYDPSSEVPLHRLCHILCIKVSHCLQYTLKVRRIGLHLWREEYQILCGHMLKPNLLKPKIWEKRLQISVIIRWAGSRKPKSITYISFCREHFLSLGVLARNRWCTQMVNHLSRHRKNKFWQSSAPTHGKKKISKLGM